MTDREMLELAARAAGYVVDSFEGGDHGAWVYEKHAPVDKWHDSIKIFWNPLKDKADAFDLMVKLHLLIMPYPLDKAVRVTRLDRPDTVVYWNECNNNPTAATMLAITRAAAEIGKLMNTTGETT